MMCPFETLGLHKSASEDEIDRQWRQLMRTVHPDKTGRDERAKLLNAARDKAKTMLDSFECHWARKEKDERHNERKRALMNIVSQMYRHEYEKLSCFYSGGDFVFPSEYSEDLKQEAAEIFKHGMARTADSGLKERLLAAEALIARMEEENLSKQPKEEPIEHDPYCTRIEAFVQRRVLRAEPSAFLSTRNVAIAFEKAEGRRVTGITLFSTLVFKCLKKKFPKIERGHRNGIKGFRGVVLAPFFE